MFYSTPECVNCEETLDEDILEELKNDSYDPPARLCRSCREVDYQC